MAKEQVFSGIRTVCEADATAVGLKAAVIVAEQLAQKPDSSIVFPTGKTPLPLYQALRAMPEINWSQSKLFQLDEYIPPHPGKTPQYETFAEFMHRELWDHVDGQAHYIKDYIQAPELYEYRVTEGNGPDLVILGIGSNGHVAFNEPGSQPDSPTRIIDLTEATLESNFGGLNREQCPRQALTLGLKAILGAKKILLLATGENKREIVQRAFNPATRPSLDCPASWLKEHPHTLILSDFDISFPAD